MKSFSIFILSIFSIQCIQAEDAFETSCPEIDNEWISTLLGAASAVQSVFTSTKEHKETKFYLGLKDSEDIEISGSDDWSALESDAFSSTKKTYFLVHGYRSSAKKKWIKNIKNALLAKYDANIIAVDWSESSYLYNFADSVRITKQVSNHTHQFLNELKSRVIANESSEILWNKLHFIGQSLGAHISGQVGNLLKEDDDFFKMERITGLDPAKPCFVRADSTLRLDKDDADFVDIIHTQTGKRDESFSFGIRHSYGHMDFYVNGGVLQPACKSKSIWRAEFKDITCSHKLARQLFTESVMNSGSDSCKFIAYPWDRTYNESLRILEDAHQRKPCDDCPEMGINAPNYNQTGVFLVFTGSEEPYCNIRFSRDIPRIKEKLELLKPVTVV